MRSELSFPSSRPASTSWIMTMMRNPAWVGSNAQVAALVAYLFALLSSGVRALIAGNLCTVVTIVAFLCVCVKRVPRSVSLPGSPSAQPRPPHAYSRKRRLSAGSLIFITTVIGVLFNHYMFSAPPAAVAQVGLDYRPSIRVLAWAGVFNPIVLGGGAYARLASGGRIPLAYMFDPAVSSPSQISGTACALQFDLIAKDLPVMVDAIAVTVKRFEPRPTYVAEKPLPMTSATVYYVAIEADEHSLPAEFRSDGTYDVHGTYLPYSAIQLIPKIPERVVVRINALQEGIYTFSLEVLLSRGNEKHRIPIADTVRYVFDAVTDADPRP